MLALKKKREIEKKEAEEAAKNDTGAASPASGPAGQVSLFGIGGEKRTKKGGPVGKKRSPGEIRIQKGKFRISIFPEFIFILF